MHLLFLAGIGNSGSEHWQRQWYLESEQATWVEHSNWEQPVMEQWLDDFEHALVSIHEPVVVIAHSLGCVLFTEWLRCHDLGQVSGAMLVAMPNVLGPEFPEQAVHFSNLGTYCDCCPAVIVASEDDPYASIEHAYNQGRALNAAVHNIGAVGHINGQSNLGYWLEGQMILRDLIHRVDR
ncbi:RBBP9/YdeN family alpha/beta hydrolase [Celerinatantimonas sp. YJH-8]|uniref:RBBP9/YdeN family alpha/beta hydrolase n=1 Tax=Celerinatantimonas sp. YJH-8 TaxID=3228714 RepID=UPI0038C45D72